MELNVQNQLLHRQFLSKISFNSNYNLLAAIADAADNVSFFHYQPAKNIFTEIFQSSSRPSGKKSCLSWSPNGSLLSLGSANLQVWKLDDSKLSPVKNFNDDFIDIKIIAWSPDSASLAYGGLSKKNAIKVRSLQSGTCGEISFELSISAVSYDPFGKYLLILARNNILYVYNCTSLTKLKEIPLSPTAQTLKNISTVKEIRSMGWSPDFNYLVCPSIDDSKVSIAFSLCRSLNFKVTHAFFGHASSISCASFSPILYEWQSETCSILALGDSHGVVSIWRISAKKQPTLLLLSNSEASSNEVIQQIEWSSTGQNLFVNLMKRYINILTFNKKCFGREISIEQKSSIIESNFGVVSAAQIHKKQVEIFSFNTQQSNSQGSSQIIQAQTGNKPDIYNFSSKRFEQKVEYVKINEQVTIKDKNNKKRIQPAMLVRREQAEKNKEIQQNINPLLPISATATMPIQYKPLNLKPLSGEIELGKLFTNKYLEIKKIQNYSMLQLLDFKDGQFQVINERTFMGNIQFVKIVEKLIYVYNKGSLFIFDVALNLQELPISLGELHKLAINSYGDVYYLSVQGFIRGFNHLRRSCYTPASIPIHSLMQRATQMENEDKKNEQPQISKNVDRFQVERDHNLYVTISESEERYFFDRQTGCWISLHLNNGLMKTGHSLRVTDLQEKLTDDFFQKINGKIVAQQPKGQTSVQQYQSNLIYYKKHNPNTEMYKENLIGLIRQLKIKGLSEKLRAALNKYFVNQQAEFYQNDASLRQRVRAIGGNVIQEFIYFKKL